MIATKPKEARCVTIRNSLAKILLSTSIWLYFRIRNTENESSSTIVIGINTRYMIEVKSMIIWREEKKKIKHGTQSMTKPSILRSLR